VGKTELCKALAEFLFDTEDAMVRIDMSEFMENTAWPADRGASGLRGLRGGRYLTEAVRRRPYSVILLDEVEKAHPDVFNILLQVLDDGRLTDGQGRTVDFRNTVIVMTNLGSDLIQEHHSEKDYDEMKAMLMEVLTRSFRPEFINRIDETVVFHPLGEEHIKSIARIQLKSLMSRLESQGFEVEVSEELLTKLVHAGFDPVYGARPLKRAIQQKVENPLAQALLSGRVIPGKTLRLGADSNGLTMTQ
jgi:ATP-dependent Clp protease ATP-binding subunit ClpB